MNRKRSALLVVVVAAATIGAWSAWRPSPVIAQSDAATLLPQGIVPAAADPGYTAPRTTWGHPDLQGLWENSEEIGIPIEKPLGESALKSLKTQEDAFAEADRRGGPTGAGPGWWYETKPFNGRTHQLVDPADGRLPPLTAWATEVRSHARQNRGGPNDSYLSMGVATRCLTRGIPGSMVPGYFMYNAGYRILQRPDAVIIQYEMIHDVRIIPLTDRPRVGKDIRLWFGDARARWEGDTLVVETTNFNDATPLLGSQGVEAPGVNEQTRVIERFTRINDKLIRYAATVDNPKVFTAPWTVALPLKRDDAYKIFEYACHEGNKGVETILRGARAEEAEALKANGRKKE